MTDTDLITAAVASSAGALVSGTLGWWDSHEPFNPRKFMGSVWRAVFAGMSWVATNQFVQVQGAVWLVAFMGGAGIEVLGNRIQGGIAGKNTLGDIQAQLTDVATRAKAALDISTEVKRMLTDLKGAAGPEKGSS